MPDNETRNAGIALCLSGGGFRATLFHLGVVKALRDYETLTQVGEIPPAAGTPPSDPSAVNPTAKDLPYTPALIDVTEIYAVSGGSVLAAHMIANWESYVGSDKKFGEVQEEILIFSQRNLRDRILRRWVLFRTFGLIAEWASRFPVVGSVIPKRSGLYSRTYWLQREYESLLGRRTLGDVRGSKGSPACHILTTSFTTGELCSFSEDHFDIEVGQPEPARTPCGHLRLSLPVAASSAFPPMFPPIELNDDMLANPNPPDHFEKLYLSDGGIFDNLGLEKFLRNRERAQKRGDAPPSTLVICDAGGSFRAGANKTFGGIFSRNVRATDILMHRIGDHAKRVVGKMDDVRDIPIRIGTTCRDPALERSVQQRMRLVRTDFDRFDPKLARLLIEHGERVTHAAMEGQDRTRMRNRPQDSAAVSVEAADCLARKAANRSFRSLILDLRDWTLIPLAILVGGLIGGSAWYLIDSHHKQIEAQAKIKKIELINARAAKLYNDALVARAEDQERKFERAETAFRQGRMDEVGRILTNGLISAGQQVQADTENAETAEAAVRKLTPALQTIEANNAPATPLHPQPVFIQFAGLLTRTQIVDLNSVLKSQGWLAQSASGERTVKAKDLNVVRFAGSNADAARRLADAINATGLLDRQVEPKRTEIVGPKNLEVWISN